MNDINTVLAAINFGNAIKNCEFGTNLIGQYAAIEKKVTPVSWEKFDFAVNKFRIRNYMSFEIALNYIETRSLEDEEYRKCYNELKNCDELHKFIKDCNVLYEFLGLSFFTNYLKKEDFKIFESNEVYRKYLELFYYFHSTKFLVNLNSVLNSKNNKTGYISSFEESRDERILSKKNRNLIQEYSNNSIEKTNLYLLEIFHSLIYLIPEIIFATNFDKVILMEKTKLLSFREKNVDKIRLFNTSVLSENPFNIQNKSFLFLSENGILVDIGLVKSGKYFFNKDEVKIKLRGILYPRDDRNLFGVAKVENI